MAFNRSNFTKKNLTSAMESASKGETTYSSGRKDHDWFKLLPGLKYFNRPKNPCKKVVNILPFMTKDGSCEFVHNVFVHHIPHADGSRGSNNYICDRNDPLCAMKKKIEDEATSNGLKRAAWEDVKPYAAKSESLYLMNPVGTDDVEVFTAPTKISATVQSFTQMLNAQAVACSGDSPIVDYASIDEGKSVVLVYDEKTYNGHTYMDITGIAFVDRKEEISDEVLKKIPDYIEMLHNVGPNDHDEMETLINGGELESKQTEDAEPEQTEEDKQAAFEAMMTTPKEEPKPETSGEDFLSEDDFKRDPYAKAPAPKPAPAPASDKLSCPNGFDIASEFGTHRQCMRCPFADKCEKVAG